MATRRRVPFAIAPEKGAAPVRIKVTKSMLNKANIDAGFHLRTTLKEWGVADYDTIPAGIANKVKIPILLSTDENQSHREMSCYRTNNRGCRFWIERLASSIGDGDIIEFALKDDQLVVKTNSTNTDAHGSPWSDDELLVCASEYIRYRDSPDLSPSKASIYRRLSSKGPTKGRSAKAIEYRFLNISAVLTEMGEEIISGLLPKRNVGSEVSDRLRAILEKILSDNSGDGVE